MQHNRGPGVRFTAQLAAKQKSPAKRCKGQHGERNFQESCCTCANGSRDGQRKSRNGRSTVANGEGHRRICLAEKDVNAQEHTADHGKDKERLRLLAFLFAQIGGRILQQKIHVGAATHAR
ncbi:MAG TPA: hypothetical protein VEK74_06135 [Burkholderiaceae bacterium]|nr:hypothetical protein [Burkholderiaceae bacterium]